MSVLINLINESARHNIYTYMPAGVSYLNHLVISICVSSGGSQAGNRLKLYIFIPCEI